jgi:hypothetical protein
MLTFLIIYIVVIILLSTLFGLYFDLLVREKMEDLIMVAILTWPIFLFYAVPYGVCSRYRLKKILEWQKKQQDKQLGEIYILEPLDKTKGN